MQAKKSVVAVSLPAEGHRSPLVGVLRWLLATVWRWIGVRLLVAGYCLALELVFGCWLLATVWRWNWCSAAGCWLPFGVGWRSLLVAGYCLALAGVCLLAVGCLWLAGYLRYFRIFRILRW
jgi:hypothetical protein